MGKRALPTMTLKMDVGVEEGAKEKTYVFEQEEFLERWRSVKSKMWQIVPGYCGELGWQSVSAIGNNRITFGTSFIFGTYLI